MERARLMKARWIMTSTEWGFPARFPCRMCKFLHVFTLCSLCSVYLAGLSSLAIGPASLLSRVDQKRLLMHSDHYPQITESLY